MDVLITTCSQEKRLDADLLPAAQRYLSGRISTVVTRGRALGKKVFILSGKYGLVTPDEEIEWYDRPLTAEDEPAIIELVTRRLAAENIDQVTFYAEPVDTPGWRPYYNVMADSCANLGITLKVELVS
ncbi:MAG TPA: hypothetical protein VGS19_24465 [Streptosporangiaceae bacterium]|nr:hypothetical protein [Streptosporangiaceae bacterium]